MFFHYDIRLLWNNWIREDLDFSFYKPTLKVSLLVLIYIFIYWSINILTRVSQMWLKLMMDKLRDLNTNENSMLKPYNFNFAWYKFGVVT